MLKNPIMEKKILAEANFHFDVESNLRDALYNLENLVDAFSERKRDASSAITKAWASDNHKLVASMHKSLSAMQASLIQDDDI